MHGKARATSAERKTPNQVFGRRALCAFRQRFRADHTLCLFPGLLRIYQSGDMKKIFVIPSMIFATPSIAGAVIVADTVADYSGVQGQNNWTYGFWAGTGSGYTPSSFVAFAPTVYNGANWDFAGGTIVSGSGFYRA